MRLYEFADAEAQLALLRTIIDNTWTAIAQQAEQLSCHKLVIVELGFVYGCSSITCL